MRKVEINITSVVIDALRENTSPQELVDLEYYWHDLITIVGHAIVRGGLLAGEELLFDDGSAWLPYDRWELIIDQIYHNLTLALDDEAIIELFSWDAAGFAELDSTVVLKNDEQEVPSYLAFVIKYDQRKLLCL